MLVHRGFKPLIGTQCVYSNANIGMVIVAHVDDFLCFGSKACLQHLLDGLKEEYECSGIILGPERSESKEI